MTLPRPVHTALARLALGLVLGAASLATAEEPPATAAVGDPAAAPATEPAAASRASGETNSPATPPPTKSGAKRFTPARACVTACAEFNTKLRGCFGDNYDEILLGCQRACTDHPALAKPCLACFPAHSCTEITEDACDAICLEFRLLYVPLRPDLPEQVTPFIKGLGGWCGQGPCPLK